MTVPLNSNNEKEAMAEFLNYCPRSRSEFKLVGLSSGMRYTCSNIGEEDIFWSSGIIFEEKYKELFKWAKSQDDFWKQNWTVTIEYDYLYEDKTPRNPMVVAINLNDNQ